MYYYEDNRDHNPAENYDRADRAEIRRIDTGVQEDNET